MKTALYILLASLALVAFLSFPAPASATEEYAARTGWDCRVCHVNPLGGGELTAKGGEFKARLETAGEFRPLSPVKRAARLIIGYLHILAGVVWFGAIFYVHILLKPAYAAKGLPKGELILGWTCLIVVGVTGAFLTYSRMPSLAAFYATRFGILLSIKIFMYLVMAGSACLVTFVLGPKMRARREAMVKQGEEYTPEELSTFDGKEGRRCYVALDGAIYDLTDSRLWKNGKHTRHLAGGDMTGFIGQAPHGKDKLDGFARVGVLNTTGKPAWGAPKRVFYVVAYLNLALVFLILGVVALWRWY